MPNTVSIYDPRYLAEVVRLAPPIHTFMRDSFFTKRRLLRQSASTLTW